MPPSAPAPASGRALERRIGELLDPHGTTLRDEPGIGPIAAATLLAEVGDPLSIRSRVQVRPLKRHRRRRGVLRRGQRAPSPAPPRRRWQPPDQPRAYIDSVTQQRDVDVARAYIDRKTAEGKTPREARRAHKRHLANRVIRRMWNDEHHRTATHSITA